MFGEKLKINVVVYEISLLINVRGINLSRRSDCPVRKDKEGNNSSNS